MRRGLRYLAGLAAMLAALYLVALGGNLLFVLNYERPAELPSGAVIVVLGGGVRADGTMSRASAERVAAAVELYASGTGARLVMTGGTLPGRSQPVALSMAIAARASGVPDSAIVVETRSRSTLQNALLSRDLVSRDAPVIVVSQRFHLARTWASFRWAGFDEVALYAADAGSPEWSAREFRRMSWEAVKWPINLARAAIVSAAGALGVPEARLLPILD